MNAPRSSYRRGSWFKAFKLDADHENVISETDEEKHRKMRLKRTPAYSGADNPELESGIDEIICSMITLIETKYICDLNIRRRMDFAQIAQFFTLDVITSLALSRSFGYLEEDTDIYDCVKTMEEKVPIMNFMSAVPVLSKIMRMHWFQRLIMPTVDDKLGMGKVKGVARQLVAQRYGADKDVRLDMIGSFVKHGLTLQEAADESLLQILVGSDTSATLIRVAMLHIIGTPQIYTRLVQEVTTTPGLPPLTAVMTHVQVLRLPYLNACLKEALRQTPVAAGLMTKVVPPEGDTLPDGTFLPPGTEIGQCVIGVHHNVEVYGPDADVFRPERWLEAPIGSEQLAHMERTHELSFGYGKFKCLGERIAKMKTMKCIAELIRRYEWRLCYPEKPMEKNSNMGLFLQKGMWVYVEKRLPTKR
ncbi:putative cytochrome p450 [Phaeomoniella chlamydospora]|uniref:Putative cytochrome p450 n=1 Tax=Phaeomoniella chlamydospora TaxID=158046 RepID=A0A0G2E8K6_PHACM|nr:putative cytochrome p450 [Phaeomoniella chlamydospora]